MHTHLASKRHQCGKGGGSMTHRHIETITFGTCLVIFARAHTHTQTHTHTHTHARTHFVVGTGTVGLPSLQALVGRGGGVVAFVTHFSGGGLRTTLGGGGVELRGLGGCSSLCFTGVFLLDFVGWTCQTAISSCRYAMQCCAVLWCVVVSLGVMWCHRVWCAVVCCGLL